MGRTAIVGFGCAGYHAARELRAKCPESHIDVYTAGTEAPANPMLTTYYASNKIPERAMYPFGDLDAIARQMDLQVFASTPVKALHAAKREVLLSDDSPRRYDDIVVATGADALVPPIPGLPGHGVFAMRTPDDARALVAALGSDLRSAVVIGGSMVGIKVVELLLKRGVKVTLADMAPYIFPLSAFADVAQIIHGRLRERGVDLLFGYPIEAVSETSDGIVSSFKGGATATGDILVFCMGTRARLSLIDKDEVAVGRAIKVDLRMRTSVPHVYAAGDCCETTELQSGQSMGVGLWANAVGQGRVAGMNIAGLAASYQGNLIHNITHFLDMDFISIGDNRIQGERVSFRHPTEGWTLEAVLNGGRIACVNILDNAHVSGPVKSLLLQQLGASKKEPSAATRLVLRKSGLPSDLIERLANE